MKKYQQGFTLIELMIVVAIIGILAAIAIPAYQGYIAKSQASEGSILLGGLKAGIGEYYSIKGSVPEIADLSDAVTAGKYSNITSSSGTFTATFKAAGSVNEKLATKTITMTYNTSDGSFTWGCTIPAELSSICP